MGSGEMEPESRTPFLDAELAGHQDRTSIGNILAPARPLSPPLRAAKSGRATVAAPHVRTHRWVLLFISTSVSTTPGIARILAFIILLDIAPHFRACARSRSLFLTCPYRIPLFLLRIRESACARESRSPEPFRTVASCDG